MKDNPDEVKQEYVVDQEDAAEFIFRVDARLGNYVEVTRNKSGEPEFSVKGFEGKITIHKDYVNAYLHHPLLHRSICSTQIFHDKYSLMKIARTLRDHVNELRDDWEDIRHARREGSQKQEKKDKQGKVVGYFDPNFNLHSL